MVKVYIKLLKNGSRTVASMITKKVPDDIIVEAAAQTIIDGYNDEKEYITFADDIPAEYQTQVEEKLTAAGYDTTGAPIM